MKLEMLRAAVLAAGLLFTMTTRSYGGDEMKSVKLDNGATVRLAPVAGIGRVAVIAYYDVGFVDEPAGMTQVAHLAEHLRCMGATASFKANESFEKANALGGANAETLPTFTYFDYQCTKADLETVLKIEAERLAASPATAELIAQESPRVYSEADAVESNPQLGLGKHAIMALSQAWFHQSPQALIRGGFDKFDVKRVNEFIHEYYRPDRLTLVIAGDFDADAALAVAKLTIGRVAKPQAPAPQPAKWSAKPRATIDWDARTSAVCIAWPASTDQRVNALLSQWGGLVMQRLMNSAKLHEHADASMVNMAMWPVGRLPLFVYATAKPGHDLETVEKVLTEEFAAARTELSTAGGLSNLKMMVAMSLNQPALTPELVASQAKQLAPRMGGDEKRATAAIVGNFALQLLMREQSMKPTPAEFAAWLSGLKDAEFRELIEKATRDNARNVVRLTPIAK